VRLGPTLPRPRPDLQLAPAARCEGL